MIIRESVKVGDVEVTLETGRIAKQASSVLVTAGESVVLVTVVGTKEGRPGADFLPLSVDYIEKTYAAGKIPGGFFKREGKLRDSEVLTSRLIDRPCRPLFPDGWRGEIQVVATVLSADPAHPTDVLAMCGASAALMISPIPWAGPIAGVCIGRVDGKIVINPSFAELERSDLELTMAASKDAIVMVEGECKELTEAELLQALEAGHRAVQGILDLQIEMQKAVGKEKWSYTPHVRAENLDARVKELALPGLQEACSIREKHARYGKMKEVKKAVVSALTAEFPDAVSDLGASFEDLKYNTMRAGAR